MMLKENEELTKEWMEVGGCVRERLELAVGQKKLSQCSDRLVGIKVAVVARSPLDRPCFANSRALLSDRMIASEAFSTTIHVRWTRPARDDAPIAFE